MLNRATSRAAPASSPSNSRPDTPPAGPVAASAVAPPSAPLDLAAVYVAHAADASRAACVELVARSCHSGGMHVTRIGFTSLKGARHVDRPFVDLAQDGPVGDRVFCLVDPARERVLRTVENPTLMQTRVTWDAGLLTVSLPGATAEGVPAFTGETHTLDYWGRRVMLEIVDGPWAAAYSEHLGYDVVLARSPAGDVVYGASVSLVTTGSLDELSRRVGTPVLDSQFRATFTLDTDAPHLEDDWIGRRLRLGEAEVEVRSAIPRCAVIDLDPDTGTRRADALRALAAYRRQGNEIGFGVDAVVTKPGRVHVRDAVEVGDAVVPTGSGESV